MTLIGAIIDAMRYIQVGLADVTFGSVVFWGGMIVAFSKGVETITGKKYIGTWVFAGLKRFFMTPYIMMKDQEFIKSSITEMRYELTTNGGGSMKDAVGALKATAENTNAIVRRLEINMKISDEIDNMMKFELDALGYWMWANRAFYNYFGLRESDVRGMNYEHQISKRDLQDVQINWLRAIETKSEFKMKYEIIDREETYHECMIEGIPIVDNNVLQGFKCIVTPICKQLQ